MHVATNKQPDSTTPWTLTLLHILFTVLPRCNDLKACIGFTIQQGYTLKNAAQVLFELTGGLE